MHRSWVLVRCWAVVVGALLVGGCAEEEAGESRPEPPDMEALLVAYEHPDGRLDGAPLADLTGVLTDTIAWLEEVEYLQVVFDAVGAALADGADEEKNGNAGEKSGPAPVATAQVESVKRGLQLQGEGFLRIDSICRGWAGPAQISPDENGLMNFWATFSHAGVEPVIWGTLSQCRFSTVDSLHEVDAWISLHMGDSLRFEGASAAPVLVSVEGHFRAGRDHSSVAAAAPRFVMFDFRLVPQPIGALEIRVVLSESGGSLIFFASESGETGFRAADGVWLCSLEQRRCERSVGAGGEEEEIVW